MKVGFKNSFLKELKKLKNKNLKNSLAACITQVEQTATIADIKYKETGWL